MLETFDKEGFKNEIRETVKHLFRVRLEDASKHQLFQALAYVVKDQIIDDWIKTHKTYEEQDAKILYYMSMEFLIGRSLGNMLISISENEEVKEALEELGLDLNELEDEEPDAALGNGGLGRLAACFLDSLSTLGYGVYGCGIRYKYGMFAQRIRDGYQVEVPDNWLKDGNPFEIRRPEYACEVKFGGYVSYEEDENGRPHFGLKDYSSVRAIPYDMPIVGYGSHVVNTLRIWDAEPINTFNLDSFDRGDYAKAIEQENLAKTIVEVLYPNDNHYAGKELRLKQQYFFISATLQTALKKYAESHSGSLKGLENKVVFQMNDTHPSMTVPELMRLLMDEHGYEWDEAWEVVTKCCAYTNHTIMAEALEKWPVDLFRRLLPRIYSIIEEINRRFILDVKKRFPDDEERVGSMEILHTDQIRMAGLAIVGSFSVNGVAA
ncbi:MAG: glycogen/starch/alpha-glucan family phosphorylase, partial [Lachnospiraceae bacterium]|nr:glycogen/starch/alpha-glucan family phosphorylase [Lachnospiraceae bacterium]